MTEEPLLALTAILVIGVGAQWVAWRVRAPAILVLLVAGGVAGPLSGAIEPDTLLGELLFPLISLSVAVILFEGGLSLDLADLRTTGRVVRGLISVGALVTGGIATAAAVIVLEVDLGLAALMGAILMVTGPTVIGPLLQQIRPTRKAGSILRWEGILIDPIGAILAVLVFEAILAQDLQQATLVVAGGIIETMAVGLVVGGAGAALFVVLLRKYLIPDFLDNVVSLGMVIAVFTLADLLHEESGLLAVTVMGIALASQRVVPVDRILEFKETLRVILISGLFILLAARIEFDELTAGGFRPLLFLAVLVLVARPLSVAVATFRSDLTWRERLFLAAVAPRGIVAAAVASVFGLRLAEEGFADAEMLVPVTFTVIVGTIAIYGTLAGPLARRLGVADPNPQGVLIVGAHPLALAVAGALRDAGVRVLLADTERRNVAAARMKNLPAFFGSILSDHAHNEIDLGGIGRLLAMTPNDEVNTLAVRRYAPVFGRKEAYQLSPNGESDGRRSLSSHFFGRILFAGDATYDELTARLQRGATVRATKLTEAFDYDAFRARHGTGTLPLFLLEESGALTVMATDEPPTPRPGQMIVSLSELARSSAPEAGDPRIPATPPLP